MKKILPLFLLFAFAIIDVYGQPPTFGSHRNHLQTFEGFDESIGAPVSGETSIEWRKDGTLLPGVTSEFYRIEDVELSDAGTYTLTATKADGSVSTNIVLDVLENTAPTNELRKPAAGTTFTPGTELYFQGYGIDRETGANLKHTWRLEYHHDGEVSPGPEVAYQERINSDTESAGWFDIPEALQPQSSDFFRVFFYSN